MKITGAEIVVKTLIEQGVDTIFGYTGGAVLNIFDELDNYSDKIKQITTSHEQGASHAADGYSRSTGKTGVVLATSGPGATNLVTGITTAFMDSIPMVCLTGNVGRALIGKDSFQETFITGVTMPVTKHNYFVRNVEDLADTIRDAFRIANEGRKGPVLIDIPKDITALKAEFIPKEKEEKKRLKYTNKAKIEEIAKLINESKRPVLYTGGGVVSSEAAKELRQLMNKASIPACNTIIGMGVIGEVDRLHMGMVGMHGHVSTNYAIENSDLLLALGVRFSDRVALNTEHFAPNATIVHVDIDASEICKNVVVEHGIVADVKDFLEQVLPLVEENKREDWLAQLDEWRKLNYHPEDRDDIIKPHQAISFVADNIGEDGIIVTDVGQHQMWAAQYCNRPQPRCFLTSGGLGTMGFGYGASIGSKLGNPEKRVVLISGDGSFHMNMNEVATAVAYGIKIIAVVMNNKALGMPRQWQHYLYDSRYAGSDFFRQTDYVKLADAFGAVGYSCSNRAEFEKAFTEALDCEKPVIIECVIERDEQVLPMIPSGGTVDDLIVE